MKYLRNYAYKLKQEKKQLKIHTILALSVLLCDRHYSIKQMNTDKVTACRIYFCLCPLS